MVVDLSNILKYFEDLKKAVDVILPQEMISWETVESMPFNLDYQHPDWVKAHFPLVLIYWNKKAGKLRDSKSEKVMYQNNFNIMTQTVWTADSFGFYFRKNKHKGFKNIIAAVEANEDDMENIYTDRQKLKKYKNFEELELHDSSDKYFVAMCKALAEKYPCDSTGQIRLL